MAKGDMVALCFPENPFYVEDGVREIKSGWYSVTRIGKKKFTLLGPFIDKPKKPKEKA